MPATDQDPDFELVPDTSWDHLDIDARRIDLNVRMVASLIEVRDFEQLFRRTGIRLGAHALPDAWLPIFIGLGHDHWMGALEQLESADIGTNGYAVHVPRAYQNKLLAATNPAVVTGRFEWVKTSGAHTSEMAASFRNAIAKLARKKGVDRVSVPNPLQPCLNDSLADIDLPADRNVNGCTLDGSGVIIGIIDDGCALAHRNFLKPGTAKSRILYLWDQGRTDPNGGWSPPTQGGTTLFDGMELPQLQIDAALAQFVTPDGLVQEDRVYEHLKYDLDIASHGTHVMDIAAGNGESLMGSEGVARAADIIFVQLPTNLVEEGGPLLEDRILQGVSYIFLRAAQLGAASGAPPIPAVVNISYGGYSGPHDGTSPLPAGIDALLKGTTDRAVVVSAGNGFEADCHAQKLIEPGAKVTTAWNLAPEDATSSQLEIWYDEGARLEMSITPPGASVPLTPAVKLGESKIIKRDGCVTGWAYHFPTGAGNRPNVIRLQLNATVGEAGSDVTENDGPLGPPQPPPMPPLTAPAPSGTWAIELRNIGDSETTFHAWIERDDMRRANRSRGQQSHFNDGDEDPRFTVADLATGDLTICVGAHNTATGEMCAYSASGPTRDGRQRPHVTAPAEETAVGGGILCASSRRAQPSRFNGTSAAAPHVTGLVALLMQYNRDCGGPGLTAEQIRKRVMDGAVEAESLPPPPIRELRHNRHQEVDPYRPPGKRQADHFADVTGKGKINVPESM